MAEAMRQVRAALGDDAIIVATREEEGGVRVTAAIDEELAYGSGTATSQMHRSAIPPPPEPDIDPVDIIADALSRHGTPHGIVDRLLNAAASFDTGDPLLALGAALDATFTFQPLPEGRSMKPLMLVGPPGAGKTLSVAKMAARATFKGRPVGVITTDTIRAGGVDQLAAFTRLLRLKLLAVEDAMALGDALDVQRGVEQVLIDSAGRNPFDYDDMTDLSDLLEATEIEPVLVLAAGGDAMEAAEIGAAFRELGARRMLLTRLDMTRRLGSILAVAHEARLSFSDVSVTPRVAEGLTPLNPVALARLLLPSAECSTRTVKHTGTFS
jgi:flagellar biosynthesis protein FlhF